MPPYSRRPPAIDPLPLGTGDFEAVSYNEQYGPPSVRPPPMSSHSPMSSRPPMPVFHQQAPRSVRTGYGAFGGNQPPAAAPNSLSPVAMAVAHGSAVGTGPHRVQAQETFVIRPRPSLRMGFSILMAGALLGGVIGITARARQNAADAAFAANHQVASDPSPLGSNPPSSVLPNILQQPPPAQPTPQPATTQPATAPQPASAAAAATKDTKDKKTGHVAFGRPAPHPWGGARPAPAAEAPKEKDPPATGKGKGKDKDDDGYTVASADNGREAKEAAAREAREKAAAAKEAKNDREASSSSSKEKEPSESKKSSKKSNKDDADAVLKAAMGATANTL